MDDLAKYNQARWDELARMRVAYSRPWLDLRPDNALGRLDSTGVLIDPTGRDVLCLAGAGGQQGPAFALLGARVTVFDLSNTQLEREREAAAYYGLDYPIVQGDMRDLSVFAADSFDLVYHVHSINFLPDVRPVYDEVVRVLRPGGQYHLDYANPFMWAVRDDEWDERGYPIRDSYVDGAPWEPGKPNLWDIWQDGSDDPIQVEGPHEFRHFLSTMVNELIARGFVLQGIWESCLLPDAQKSEPPPTAPEPGSWDHFLQVCPPYLLMMARLGE
jgi:SAM-dependent methyltransferase